MDVVKVLSRLSVPGVVLMALGAALCYGGGWLARKWFQKKAERAALAFKWVGLALALAGGLILLDLI